MKIFFRFILYMFIVFSIIFGGTGTLRIGPFSLRHVCMILLFVYILFNVNKIRSNNIISMYLLYIAIYLICNIINGEVFTRHFLQSLYTYHLPSVIVAFAIPLIVKNFEQLKTFTYAIIVLYMFNAIITIAQFINQEWAWQIGQSLATMNDDKAYMVENILKDSDSLLGYTFAPGIIGFAVTNGYILASFFPTLSINLWNKITIKSLVDIICILIAVIAVFCVQQRMTILTVGLFLIFLLFRAKSKNSKILFFVIFVMLFFSFDIDSMDMGRISSFTDGISSRENLLYQFNSFIYTPMAMWGGYLKYINIYGMPQHNTILASWVLGGIFNMLYFSLFYIILLVTLLKKMHRAYKHRNTDIIVYASSCVIYLLYSQTHSDGLHSGSPMFWLLFALLLSSEIVLSNVTPQHT